MDAIEADLLSASIDLTAPAYYYQEEIMRQLIYNICMIFVILCIFSSMVYAERNIPQIICSADQKTIVIPIVINEAIDIYGINIKVNADTPSLEFIGAQLNNGLLDSKEKRSTNYGLVIGGIGTNEARIAITAYSETISGPGLIVNLTYRLNEPVLSTIMLSQLDCNEKKVSGGFEINKELFQTIQIGDWDMDQNGVIGLADAIYMLQQNAGLIESDMSCELLSAISVLQIISGFLVEYM